MKKVLALFLSVILVFALAAPAFADEAPKATTVASATTAKRGDEITFTLKLDQEIEVKSGGFEFTGIDSNVFEFVPDDEYSWDIGTLQMNEVSEELGAAFVFKSNKTISGELISIRFKVKADAPFGTTEVKFVPAFKYKDPSGSEVAIPNAPVAVGTTITITHDCVPATTCTKDANYHWYECTVPGCNVEPTKVAHSYDDDCDTTCNVSACSYVRPITHSFTELDKDATHHWNKCSVCGEVNEDSKIAHGGGTATCLVQAVCSTCGQSYGELANHKWIEEVDPQYLVGNPTCKDKATYRKSCEVCGIAHGSETFESGEPDPSLHKGGSATCLAKAICTVCGLPYGDYADHVYTKKVEDAYKVSDAACNKKAVYKKSCTVCGVAHATETFETGEYDETKHVYDEVVKEEYLVSAATCNKKAVYKKSCTVCGKAHATETFETGSFDETKHVYGEVVKDAYKVSDATCNKKAVYKKSCTVCGKAHATETFETGSFDETKHVYDEVVKEEYLVSAATCNKKAVYKKSCTVCGKAHATETFETGTFDATNHVGEKTEGVGFEGATCKKEGYTGDTICQSCGEPITIGTVIKKTPHRIENWTVSKEATETEEGEKSGKCVECEEIYTVKTAKLATSVKPENIEGVEGAKIEAVGDTKLPENTVAGVEDVTEQITELMKDEAFQAELKEYLKETGEDESKVAFAGFAYGIGFPENNATNGDAVENLDASIKLPGKVKVTIPVSATLYAGYENVTILAYDYENDKAFVMPFTYENGAIIVESDSIFNELMLVGNVKKAPAPTTTTTTANPEVPQMGDSSEVVLFITLAIVSLLTLGVMLISKRAKASK